MSLSISDLRFAFWGAGAAELARLQTWIDAGFTSEDIVFNNGTQFLDSNGAAVLPDEMKFRGAHILKDDTQSIPANTLTTVAWQSEAIDTHGFWAVGNPNNLVIPAGMAGWYDIHSFVAFAGGGTGSRAMAILKNGVIQNQIGRVAFSLAGVGISLQIRSFYELAEGDTLSVQVQQSGIGSLNLSNVNGTMFLTAQKVNPHE